MTPTGDKLIIDGGGSVVELPKDDVMCVTYRGKKGDVNEDMTVDLADIATIISIMAGAGGDDNGGGSGDDNNSSGETGNAPSGAVAVELGLPSGTKWANMNVGADQPEDYGLFFAWGETVGYGSDTSDGRSFDWASYKWCNGSYNTITKYCTSSSFGTVDNKTVLDLEDDAARANWGGQWVMPTYDEIVELVDNTTSEWMTVNGINGRKFTSKTNGNSIFLPAAGWRNGSLLNVQTQGGYYWSATVFPSG